MKMLPTKRTVSIIIVTFNSKSYILSCLKSLYQSSHPISEIIVVDNNSTDGTIRLISQFFPKVKIIESKKNLGYAGGNNLGIKKAQGKYVAVINPDTQVSKNWLEPLINGLLKENIEIAQPKIMLQKNKNLINCTGKVSHFLGFEWLKDYRKKTSQIHDQFIDSFSGSIFLTTKSFFMKMGGFDESFFMYYEDGDLSWRTRLSGKKIFLVSDSVAYHDYKYIPDENYQKTKQKFYYLERNRLLMILKNYSIRTLILILPAIILMELGMIAYFINKGWALNKIKGYLWIFKKRNMLYKKRRDIQKKRVISEHEFCRNFDGSINYEELSNPILNLLVNPVLNGYWKVIKNFI